MKNKKTIMSFAAVHILIFHLWINVTNSKMELFLKSLGVIGVDLFFFVSSYSIEKKERIEYKNFIKDRFKKVYLKFIMFTIIGALYFKWNFFKWMKTIFGIELLNRGGASFLWFLPGIMIIYLLLPLYKKLDLRSPKKTPLITLTLYLVLTVIISTCTTYKAIFILTNRIPIILLGFYFAKHNVLEYLNANKMRYWFLTVIILMVGFLISYYTFINHVNLTWYKDVVFILYIPLIIGLILLLNKINENIFSKLIGSSTLELYGLQMLFGFKLANRIFKITNIKLLSNILTIISLIILAVIIQKIGNTNEKIYRAYKENKRLFSLKKI